MTWTLPLSRRNVLGLLAVLMALPLACQKEEKKEEGEEAHAAPVKWEPAEKADLEEWTELLGTTQPLPNHVAHVSAAVGGYVLSVLPSDNGKSIVEGQRVKKGQILVHLDDRVLRANREKLLVADPELQEQIKQAEHTVQLARIEVERLERLQRNSGSSVPLVTPLEMDKARLALKDAESKYKGVKAKEDIARAEVKAIDEQIAQYVLRAPIGGQLGMVHVSPGQTLATGATVAEIVNLDEIDVLCFVPPSTVAHLELKQPVHIDVEGDESTDAVKQEREDGHIVFISDQAQAETGTVAVKARFSNKYGKLRANTLVRIKVQTEKKRDCLTIPESALLEDQEEPAVLIVEKKKEEDKEGEDKKDEKEKGEEKKGEEKEQYEVHRYVAKLGLRDRDKHRVEILGLFEVKDEKKKEVPLKPDTLFVVEGGHGLEDGDLVALKKEEEHEGAKKDEDKKDEK
jgi:RND family efflux transporter MFP subunit